MKITNSELYCVVEKDDWLVQHSALIRQLLGPIPMDPVASNCVSGTSYVTVESENI